METGAERIAAERQRQIEVEGWTPEHDDEHTGGSLAMAAALYASPEPLYARRTLRGGVQFIDPWPWRLTNDKRGKHNRIRELEKAGALIAAEIDRLLRAEAAAIGREDSDDNETERVHQALHEAHERVKPIIERERAGERGSSEVMDLRFKARDPWFAEGPGTKRASESRCDRCYVAGCPDCIPPSLCAKHAAAIGREGEDTDASR